MGKRASEGKHKEININRYNRINPHSLREKEKKFYSSSSSSPCVNSTDCDFNHRCSRNLASTQYRDTAREKIHLNPSGKAFSSDQQKETREKKNKEIERCEKNPTINRMKNKNC